MVLVTDKQYSMDAGLKKKLDLMCYRCTKQNHDNWIIIDGDEGLGKTNLSVGVAYYMAQQTGRKFDLDNVYFDVDKLIEDAKSTKEQVFLWDEAALGGLAADWFNKSQKNLIKLSMIVRKHKHIFILNIPKFFKLNEYLIVDRSIALLHVYARNNIEIGRFIYYNKKLKEMLYNDWRRSKLRPYGKYAKKSSVKGSFSKCLGKILDEDAYEKKKDEAIMNFDNQEDELGARKLKEMYYKWKLVRVLLSEKWTQVEIAKKVGVTPDLVSKWNNLNVKHPLIEQWSP